MCGIILLGVEHARSCFFLADGIGVGNGVLETVSQSAKEILKN
jgi:hypothetical protein